MPKHRPPLSGKRKRKRPHALFRFCRYWYIRLVRLEGHPREIARGLAVGVFSGFFPFFGGQTAIAIFLAFLVRGNKIAAAAGTWITNPVTDVPIFLFNYKLGESILGRGSPTGERDIFQIFQSRESWWQSLTSQGGEILLTWFFGCLISATIAATLAYFLSLDRLYRWRSSWRRRKPH
jgi:uncharacterized protein